MAAACASERAREIERVAAARASESVRKKPILEFVSGARTRARLKNFPIHFGVINSANG